MLSSGSVGVGVLWMDREAHSTVALPHIVAWMKVLGGETNRHTPSTPEHNDNSGRGP